MIDTDQLLAAYKTARADLLSQQHAGGSWPGELCSSPLATATAVSALVMAEQHGRRGAAGFFRQDVYEPEDVYWGDLSELVVQSLHWLARHQNPDGGWGDTDKSRSNIATTILVQSAFHLTAEPAGYTNLLQRAQNYVDREGGVAALRRRYGADKTFSAPILANAALAGLVSWRDVPSLPFELAALPQALHRFLRLPVVSYAVPALVAIGLAKYVHQRPLNPVARLVRRFAIEPSLRLAERMQPESGGFLEAIPLTSFVVMCLASVDRAETPVVRRGVEFLLASVRGDGSWPIDTNLATWNTTLSINALAAGGEDVGRLGSLKWLLDCQQRKTHPFTKAAPGGWAWTDASGGVPDADDTAGALLALAAQRDLNVQGGTETSPEGISAIDTSARRGAGWLLDLQNVNGGWPTFCRGWGTLPFDRSGTDLTAHAMRALHVWKNRLAPLPDEPGARSGQLPLAARIDLAVSRGIGYLKKQQRPDGSWIPLWFGNQHRAGEENPIFGTSRVLFALRDLGLLGTEFSHAGLNFLVAAQQPDGGWGGGPTAVDDGYPQQASSVEETSLAVEALLAAPEDPAWRTAADRGVGWLIAAVRDGRHLEAAPIGLYFARLWYYEKLYPNIHAVAALGTAVTQTAYLSQHCDRPLASAARS